MNAEQLAACFTACVGVWCAGFAIGYVKAWIRRIGTAA